MSKQPPILADEKQINLFCLIRDWCKKRNDVLKESLAKS
jgi:hypothetical protein